MLFLLQKRKELGLTQKQAALLLGTSQQNYARWESEVVEIPRDKLLFLAKEWKFKLDAYLKSKSVVDESIDQIETCFTKDEDIDLVMEEGLNLIRVSSCGHEIVAPISANTRNFVCEWLMELEGISWYFIPLLDGKILYVDFNKCEKVELFSEREIDIANISVDHLESLKSHIISTRNLATLAKYCENSHQNGVDDDEEDSAFAEEFLFNSNQTKEDLSTGLFETMVYFSDGKKDFYIVDYKETANLFLDENRDCINMINFKDLSFDFERFIHRSKIAFLELPVMAFVEYIDDKVLYENNSTMLLN